MGFMDELKKLARPYAEDEDDFDDEYDEEELDEEEAEDEEPEEEERPARAARSARQERSGGAAAATARQTARPASAASVANNIVNLHTSNNLQVMLVKPVLYEEVSEIANHLRNKCAVVLNLETTNKDTARRLVDFLTGCAYVLDGNIKKVATNTYIITPFNVDIVGNLMEEVENSGEYF